MRNVVFAEIPRKTSWKDMNITKDMWKALLNLRKDPEIIIQNADKGMGMVAMSKDWYEEQVYKHLDSDGYKKLRRFNKNLVRLAYENLTSKGYERDLHDRWEVRNQDINACSFYILPKIHKNPIKSRPITSAKTYFSRDLSVWVTEQLNSVLHKADSVVINSLQVITDLNELPVHGDPILVTYDVEALYPSMSQKDTLLKVKDFLSTKWSNEKRVDYVLKALDYLMMYHFVEYAGNVYRQIKGIAMGANFAPPLANIYLHQLFLPIFEKFKDILLFQKRYIDDGFIIVKGGSKMEVCKKMLRAINSAHKDINITTSISTISCVFLDIYIYKGERYEKSARLDTRVYFKPTNKFLWLNSDSSHPRSLLQGVIKGELIRYVRLCSSKYSYNAAKLILWRSLRRRGYEMMELKKVFRLVPFKNRTRWVKGKPRVKQKRQLGFNVESPYHNFWSKKLGWKSLALSRSRDPWWRFANLRDASIAKPRGGFTRVGTVKFRRGKQVGDLLTRKAKKTPS